MRIELQSGGLRLGQGQILRVVDGAGASICARAGTIWITEEHQTRDVVLEPGGCYRLRQDGVAIVHALGGDAEVTLA